VAVSRGSRDDGGVASEADLRRLAYRDHLTGLPNRAAMQKRVDEALQKGKHQEGAVALLFCDLDGLKLVNDGVGYTLGDAVLVDVAQRLQAIAGPSMTVSHYSGGEFVVLIEDLPYEVEAATAAALEHADQIAQALAAPFSAGGARFEMSVSIGIATYPWHASYAVELEEAANAATHTAKRNGRAQAVVYAPAAERSYVELEATLRVRQALNAGQLELHYQPVIEIADGMGLGGLEALVRWNDPDRGLVLPGRFLPLIEHSPLLEELGEWVITEVCRQLEEWRPRGFTPRISFNVPVRQLRRPGFAEFVERTAEETGADLTRIAAELTESGNVDLDPIQPVLERLRSDGLVLSLDDFGSGYSSFQRLRDMPFSLLKTDLSFMRGVPEDRTAVELVEAMLRLGEALGLVVIVEGVERQEQLDALLEIGGRVAQGYLLGRPAPAAEIEARFN
jgi:diguanylate cyclase (GGDEF)-like protein